MQGRDERLPVGCAQLPGWEPAGASSPILTGCSPGRKDGSARPPLSRLSPTVLLWLPRAKPGSRRGAEGNPGRSPREKGIPTLSAASPRPTAGPTPRVSDKRVISFVIIILFPSPPYTWL